MKVGSAGAISLEALLAVLALRKQEGPQKAPEAPAAAAEDPAAKKKKEKKAKGSGQSLALLTSAPGVAPCS
jgi:hypothetical protein